MRNELIISDDKIRSIILILITSILSVFLFILTMQFFSMQSFLFTFVFLTGLWFSIQYLFRFVRRWKYNKSIVVCKDNNISIHLIDGSIKTIPYSQIKEVKISRNWKCLRIFLRGNFVEHPSGWDYTNIVYWFNRSKLEEYEAEITKIMEFYKISVSKL